MLFTGSENIVPSRSYTNLEILKIWVITVGTHKNFKRDFPKMDIFRIWKSIFSNKFLNIPLKYTLGIKTQAEFLFMPLKSK